MYRESWFPWKLVLWVVIVLGAAIYFVPGGVKFVSVAWLATVAWFAGLGTLLIFGTALFWVVLFVAIIGISYISDDEWLEEHEYAPFWAFLGAAAIFGVCGDVNLFKLAWNNKVVAFLGLLAYICIGFAYAVPKFRKYAARKGVEYNSRFTEEKKHFYRSNNLKEDQPIPQEFAADWSELGERFDEQLKEKIDPTENKARIFAWAYTWIFNLIEKIIRNPLRWLYERVWLSVRQIYERVAQSVFAEYGNFGKDVKVATEPTPPVPPPYQDPDLSPRHSGGIRMGS